MSTIGISTATTRMAKTWKYEDMYMDDFISKLKTTKVTSETMDEYKNLPKGKQDNIKDVGGYVMGKLKGGKRRKECVLTRTAVTLDMDYATVGILDELEFLADYKMYAYSTHKSAPDKPRYRLVILLSRDVTPDEYGAISRKIAEEIGMELFDPTTFETNRLMYWPSTSKDGVFEFRDIDGDIADVDAILAKYTDWHDVSSWPVSPKEEKTVASSMKKQENPLEKKGIIGAFNRTYSVTEAIDTFLTDVYKPSGSIPGRYDYIPADSSAGVIIYDDMFAYSHHASDPACNRLLNAFDLVRVHKFRDLDADSDAEGGKLPSFKAMQEFATKDDKVKATLMDDKEREAVLDFEDEADWRTQLSYNKQGLIVNNLRNLLIILNNDPNLKGIVFNQLSDGMEIKGKVPWEHPSKFWRDADDSQLISYIDLKYGNFSQRNYDVAVSKTVDDRSYHPIRQYLESLPEWDHTERVDTLLIDYLNAVDNGYVRAVTRKTLVAAIARVYNPGVKFDTMLVMAGPQGKGKSTLIAKLAGDWFSDSLLLSDAKDKTAAEKLQGYWILEIGELAGMKKTDIETLRGFLSRQNDIYRAAFGRRATPHPRQCVFIGTTNADTYLRDITGNRRFWPVKTPGDGVKQSWDLTAEEVAQIWAEVLVYYKQGETLHLSPEFEELAKVEQREAMEMDEREGVVRDYLDMLLPTNWDDMSIFERRNFINGSDFDDGARKGTVKRTKVCTMEIWCECFGKERGNLKRQDANEITAILNNIEGWHRIEGKMRFSEYGVVRAFIRDEE